MIFVGDLKLRTDSLAELRLKRAALNEKLKRMKNQNEMYVTDFWSREFYKKMMYNSNMIDILERVRLHYLKYVKEVDTHVQKKYIDKDEKFLKNIFFQEYL